MKNHVIEKWMTMIQTTVHENGRSSFVILQEG